MAASVQKDLGKGRPIQCPKHGKLCWIQKEAEEKWTPESRAKPGYVGDFLQKRRYDSASDALAIIS
jgi:hypothetical protein